MCPLPITIASLLQRLLLPLSLQYPQQLPSCASYHLISRLALRQDSPCGATAVLRLHKPWPLQLDNHQKSFHNNFSQLCCACLGLALYPCPVMMQQLSSQLGLWVGLFIILTAAATLWHYHRWSWCCCCYSWQTAATCSYTATAVW